MKPNVSLVTEPFFICCAGRSGSTHLRLMLDNHPQIACMDEIDYTVKLISDNGDWPQLDIYYEWLETDRIFQSNEFEIDRSFNYPQLANSFLCQKRDRARKPLVGATVHRHFDRLLRIWPDARFIHLVRDGRDVAHSCVTEMSWHSNYWTGVEYWMKSEQLWTRLCEIVPVERRMEITYENLIGQTVETLTQICNFIGVSYDQMMLSYPDTTTYSSPDPSFIGQWRRKLSDREIQLVESRIADRLLERGYELSGLPLIKVTPAMKQKLRLHDWWTRLQFRIKRNGLALFLEDYLSRHLIIKSWQKSVRLKLNAIEKAHLK